MDRKLDNQLCSIAPHLFGDRYASMQNTALCWGFECGSGWYKLLEEAADALEPLIVEYINKNPYPNEFPWWIFSRYNWKIVFQMRCYSFLAIWNWALIAIGLQQPEPWWPRASQVKEKYGTLRFYLTSGTEEMYAITDKAESRSETTCEICGKAGKRRGDFWLSTRCSPCWKKEQNA